MKALPARRPEKRLTHRMPMPDPSSVQMAPFPRYRDRKLAALQSRGVGNRKTRSLRN